MPLKIVFFYNQANRGWTETFYSNASSNPIDFVNLNFTPKFYQNIVGFRNSLTYLYAVRASNIGSPRAFVDCGFGVAVSGTRAGHHREPRSRGRVYRLCLANE